MSLDLAGRVAIVTGASRGIGLGIAHVLAAHDAHVILVARGAGDTLEQAEQQVRSGSGRVLSLAGDVSDSATAAAATRLAHREFKRLDVLVNNAGVLEDGLIGMISESRIRNTLAVNVAAVLHFTQAGARLMASGPSGSIVNVSSIIGTHGSTGQMLYAASKAAVIGATRSAAKELAPKGVRVNALAPGYIDTAMISALSPAIHQQRLDSIGMQRIGTVADVADVALFLASDLSRYVTGQVIGVDGAMLI